MKSPVQLLRRVPGLGRLGDAFAAGSPLVIGLVLARTHAVPLGEKILAHMDVEKASRLIAWGPIPKEEIRIGALQYNVFIVTLALVACVTAVYAGVARLLTAWRPAEASFKAIAVALAVSQARAISPFALTLALFMMACVAMGVSSSHTHAAATKATPATPRLGFLMFAEGIALGWGATLSLRPKLGSAVLLGMLALGALGAYRGARGDQRARCDAVAGAPLLLLPLVGLLREPSLNWTLAALTISLTLRMLVVDKPKWVDRTWHGLAVVAAPWALGAILAIPLRFRELGTVNHRAHEGIHMGWVNSVHFGKFMYADAGLVYGPLREYALTLLTAMMGTTAEHLRIAQILVNVTGLGLLIAASWRIVRGNLWMHLLMLYVLLHRTCISFFLDYTNWICFGWADLARAGFASVGLVGAIAVITSRERDEHRDSAALSETFRVSYKHLFGWGVVAGIAVLYSQDFGLCAVGAVGLALGADALFRDQATTKARWQKIFKDARTYVGGLMIPLAVFTLSYIVAGRGKALAHAVLWASLLASGAWSGSEYPVAQNTFDHRDMLLDRILPSDAGAVLDWVAPLAICCVAAVVVISAAIRGKWTRRTTLVFALWLYAITAMRHGLLRADIYHLRNDGTPAMLLLGAMASDAALALSVRVRAAKLRVPIGAAFVAFVWIVWPYYGDGLGVVRTRLDALASGHETPVTGPKYANDDIPRAGDIAVPSDVRAVVVHVTSHTSERDPVLCSVDFIMGGEYAFLTARRNPTKFDVPHELLTREDQNSVYEALQNDPPAYVIGSYFGMIGPESKAYIEQHWVRENVPNAGTTVWKYNPPLAKE